MRKPLLKSGSTLWLVAGFIFVVIGLGFAWHRHAEIPPARRGVPEERSYPDRPAAFNASLHRAYVQIRATRSAPSAVRELAMLYQANRLYEPAKRCYRAIAAGLTAKDHYYLATMSLMEGDRSTAQAELHAVLKKEPRYLPARIMLADLLFKNQEQDQAAIEYAAVLAFEENQPQAAMGIARMDLQAGKDAEAIGRLKMVLGVHPESSSAAALLAQIMARRGETEAAMALRQWSERVHDPIMADPWLSQLLHYCYDAQTLSLKFEDYFKAGQIDEALPLIDRVKELDPDNGSSRLLRGMALARVHRDKEATVEFYAALAREGDPEKICPPLVASLQAAGEGIAAAKVLDESLQKLPDSLTLLSLRAEAAIKDNDEATALRCLRRVVQEDPLRHHENVTLARLLWGTADQAEAVACLQRVVKAFPDDVSSRGMLGQYYLENGNTHSAISLLEEAVKRATPGSVIESKLKTFLAAACLAAGKTEVERHQLEKAAGFFQQTIEVDTGFLEGYAELAHVYVGLRQYRHAAEALEKIAQAQPANPTVQLRLGDVLYQEGKPAEAHQKWQRALDLIKPDDSTLRGLLQTRLNGDISSKTFN